MSSVQPPPPSPTPAAPQQAAPVTGDQVDAEIVKLPPNLNAPERPVTLRGEVQGQNPDGSTRIATPRGPVDVQLPQPVPSRGTNVEVTVPPGTPPRHAQVTLPQQQAQPQPQSQTPVPPTQTPSLPPVQTTISTPNPAAPQAQQSTGQSQTAAPQTQNASAQQQSTAPQTPTQARTPAVPLLQQAGNEAAATASGPKSTPVTPQGLLDFLKTSLQTILKTPANRTDTPQTPAQPQAPVPGQSAQRPLQLGQLARLTPLPPGQSVIQTPAPAAQQATTTPAILSGATTQAAAPAAGQAATPNLFQTAIPQVGAQPGAQAITPINVTQPSLLQSILGAGTQITAPQTAGAQLATPTISADPIARLFLPLLSTSSLQTNTATPAPTTAPNLLTQLTLNTAAQTTIKSAAPPPLHAPIITTNAQTPQTQPHIQPVDVRVSGLLPSAPAQALQNPAVSTLLNGTPTTPVIFAQVAGQTTQGLPVVTLPTFTTAPDGTQKPATAQMVLQFPARGLTPASVLKLDILPGAPGATATTATTAATPFSFDASMWDALDDAMRTLPAQTQGTNAQAALSAALPKPGSAAFTAPVLMFVAALRGGDVTAWMGDKGIDALRTARKADTLSRVTSDFASTARRLGGEDARPSGEWRSLTMPMLWGSEVSRIHMHYHNFDRDSDNPQNPGKQKGTRFVMDLSLTRMGPMQIDGFSIGKKLDVTLRSEQSFSPGARETMRQRYHSAINNIGFAGELNFAAAPDHKGWVEF